MTTDTTRRLAADETRTLIDFARAFKAAARAVVLYPPAHPAIAATLSRIVDLTSVTSLPVPLRIGVLADGLLLDGLAPERPDAAVTELAVLLHAHLIGELTVRPGGEVDAWRSFLVLVGRTPDEVRTDGGINRAWCQLSGGHVDLREIDYAEVLREGAPTGSSSWADIIAHCLSGERPASDTASRDLLVTAGGDLETLASLVDTLDGAAVKEGRDEPHRAAALVRLLDRVTVAVGAGDPGQVEVLMENLALTLARLSPDMMMAVLGQPAAGFESPALTRSIVRRMSDRTKARFVARHAMADGPATERLAQVFRTLVPEERREDVLALAKEEVSSAVIDQPGFEQRWSAVAHTLLTTYSDAPFVSDHYAQELGRARDAAIDVERVNDDPPERISAWLQSVTTSEIRQLDLALVRDVLRIEDRSEQWTTLMGPAVTLIDDLLLVGDFEAADGLVRSLVSERSSGGSRQQAASAALDTLIAGPMMRHVTGHLAGAADASFECVKRLLLALGDAILPALADALVEDRDARTRERLVTIFVAFGASGRHEVDRLKSSSSAMVRLTAISLLRQFGGNTALPELTVFLDDHQPQVQREAVRAILGIASDEAYAALGQALIAAAPAQRDAIVTAVTASRDERRAPLFAYILEHVDHRGSLAELYARAIGALGALKDPEGIAALKQALHRGEWWAPRRSTALRSAAAAALARIGSADAVGVLDEAAASGCRGARAAARLHLTSRRRGAQG
jgi:hypothetical protein